MNDYATIVSNKKRTIGATLADAAKIHAYNQERIDLYGGTVSRSVFANPTFEHEIRSVANPSTRSKRRASERSFRIVGGG